MNNDLRQIAWMRVQWKRFRRILWGCSGAAWLLCCASIILVGPEQFMILVSLVFMFLVVTGVFIYLFFVSRQERKTLEQKAIAIRTALVKGELAESDGDDSRNAHEIS